MDHGLSEKSPIIRVYGSFRHFLVEDLVQKLRMVQITSPIVQRKGWRLAHWCLRNFLVCNSPFVIEMVLLRRDVERVLLTPVSIV